jgi:hypothetical protein
MFSFHPANEKCLATAKTFTNTNRREQIAFACTRQIMRYPCIGFPSCLKTFENGYVLRSHQISCEHAQRELNKTASRQEHARSIQYDYDINGMKCNKLYPTFTGLDHTEKFHFRDRTQLTGTNMPPQPQRRLRQPPDPKLVTTQAKSTSMDFSGYYT